MIVALKSEIDTLVSLLAAVADELDSDAGLALVVLEWPPGPTADVELGASDPTEKGSDAV